MRSVGKGPGTALSGKFFWVWAQKGDFLCMLGAIFAFDWLKLNGNWLRPLSGVYWLVSFDDVLVSSEMQMLCTRSPSAGGAHLTPHQLNKPVLSCCYIYVLSFLGCWHWINWDSMVVTLWNMHQSLYRNNLSNVPKMITQKTILTIRISCRTNWRLDDGFGIYRPMCNLLCHLGFSPIFQSFSYYEICPTTFHLAFC